MLPKYLTNVIVTLVCIVWVANFFAQFVIKDYHPDPSINGVFGAIVGGALALTRRTGEGGETEGKRITPAEGDD